MLLVRVGNVEFHGHTTHGFLIGPGGFVGWEGAPASRRENTDRPSGHGTFTARAFKGARLLRLSGTALAESEAELTHMGQVLAGIGAADTQITVTTEAGTSWATGSVEGETRFDRIGGALEASFTVTFLLPDPRKYGEVRETVSTGDSVTFGSVVSAYHRGNFPAAPQFTVTPLAGFNMTAGYQIKGKGRTFEVPGPLNQGSVDKVDFRTGTVRRNGVLVTGVVPRTFELAGGELVDWRLWPLSGSGTATMHLPDTFI